MAYIISVDPSNPNESLARYCSLSLSLGMCVDGVWLRVYFCMLAYVYARWYNAIKITNPLNATLQQIAWTTLFFM